jgi:hypothetical protein
MLHVHPQYHSPQLVVYSLIVHNLYFFLFFCCVTVFSRAKRSHERLGYDNLNESNAVHRTHKLPLNWRNFKELTRVWTQDISCGTILFQESSDRDLFWCIHGALRVSRLLFQCPINWWNAVHVKMFGIVQECQRIDFVYGIKKNAVTWLVACPFRQELMDLFPFLIVRVATYAPSFTTLRDILIIIKK